MFVCASLRPQAGGGAASDSEVGGQRGAAGAGTTAGGQTDGTDTSNKIQGRYKPLTYFTHAHIKHVVKYMRCGL